MDPFYKHLKAGKDYGFVHYGGIGYFAFKPCWALLKHKGIQPWVAKAKKLGAYSVRVEYRKQGIRAQVFYSDRWQQSWQ